MLPPTLVLLSFAALALAGPPSATNATALAIVDAQWIGSGFENANISGFGLTLHSTALLTAEYAFGDVVDDQTYTADQVAKLPTIFLTPLATAADTTQKYTLMLADASSLGDPDPAGNFRHYLANGLTATAATSSAGATTDTTTPTGGTVITAYAGPGPLPGSGPHRYAWMIFTEPDGFTPPANLSKAGVAASHWSVNDYVTSTKLTLIGATFFIVENGTPTGSVVSITPVNTATITGGNSSSTSSTGTASGAGSTGTSPPSAAGRVSAGVGACALAAVGVLAALL